MSSVDIIDIDYTSMTSEEQSSTLDYELEITSHLTLNSLILLGFNTDEYIQIYSGIAFDITPVSTKTFEKPNEKMLFIILHYLLCILDREEFLLSIEKCWPFLDNKERGMFRKALHISLIRLIERNVIPNSIYQQNLLVLASGPEIWNLLHALTDRALDHVLREFRESQFPEQTNHHLQQLANGNDDNGTETDNANVSLFSSSTSFSRDAMIQEIDEKVQDVKTLILQFNTERRQWEEYLVELDQRLTSAKKSIKQTEQKLREIHLQDEYNILAEQGKAKRTKLLARIAAQKDLLQSFLQSPLLTDAEKHMEEELALQRAEASNPLDQASAKLGRVNAPTRRKMLSKEEMEAYKISMRDAISTLVEKMEEVGTLV